MPKVGNYSLTTAIFSDTVRGVSSVQNGATAAHALLSDKGAGTLFIVFSVQTGAAGAGAHTRLILLTGGTPQRYNNTAVQQAVHKQMGNMREHICMCAQHVSASLRQKLCRLQLMQT